MEYDHSFEIYKKKDDFINKKRVSEESFYEKTSSPLDDLLKDYEIKKPDDEFFELSQKAVDQVLPKDIHPSLREVSKIGLGYLIYDTLIKYLK